MRPVIKKPLLKMPDLEGEIWMEVPGWEGQYMASNKSRIKSLAGWRGSEKILKPVIRSGYPSVTFWKDGRHEHATVHRLVMSLFKDNPDNLPEVDHLFGNKMDMSLDHLEYVSSSDNKKRAYGLGLMVGRKGESHHLSRLKNEDVEDIFNSPLSYLQLSEKYNITTTAVGDIKIGKTWSHITGKEYVKMNRRRLSEKEILDIFYDNGTYRALGLKYDVAFSVIQTIKNRQSHLKVTEKLK